MVHRFDQSQRLHLPLDAAWQFFSNPENLNEITPPELRFKILSGADRPLEDGQIIVYKIRLAPLVWKTWITEIKAVDPGNSFVDEQRIGPYKFWHHHHKLQASGEDTIVHDQIHYQLGFGLAGNLVHALYVRKQLAQIFEYRRLVLDNRFNVSQ